MPTNLPAEYYQVEERYKAATDIREKITTLEELISTVPKHKGTDKLRADLRQRLSKLKTAADSKKGASRFVSAFHIDKEGAGQAVVIGAPNVGKSALVKALTNAEPEVAPFPFTTWGPTPGMMEVDHVQIQLIDTPPLSREYIEADMMDLIRRSDMLLLVINLETYPIEQLQECRAILADHHIAPIGTTDESHADHRFKLLPTLIVVNKNDDEASDEEFEILCELLDEEWSLDEENPPEAGCPMIPVSAKTGRNLDVLGQKVIDTLNIMRVYSKPPLKDPDFTAPFVLERGSTVEEFAAKVHRDFYDNLKSARIWGSGSFDGQMVSREYVLHEGDVVELKM